MTPRDLLNLVHDDMGNKPYPAIELIVKDLKMLEVNHPNPAANSAVQFSKLDFMNTSVACLGHAQKALKSLWETLVLKSIPNFEDF